MTLHPPGRVTPLTWARTGLFYLWIAGATIVIGAWGLPQVLRRPEAAHRVAQVWNSHVVAACRFWCGLRIEVRGTVPTGPALVAAKHQSALDIFGLASILPRRAFVMKREVLRVPIMGWFAHAAGCIPIDRSKGGEAMAKIGATMRRRLAEGRFGQIIVYPEGTRTHPGERRRYKHGIANFAAETGLPVTPVAVNAGLFWPRSGYPIRAGRAVIAFLPEMTPAPGEAQADFLARLETVVERASDALMAEAGFVAPAPAEAHRNRV